MTFRERLRVPLRWWVVGLAVGAGAAAEIHQGAGGWRAVLPYVVLLPLVVVGLLTASRDRVAVVDDVLHVPGARAPLDAFGPAEVLGRADLRLWLGPRAQREAWVRVKPWLTTAVRLPVTDPDDDTPYWLVGVRDPVGLAVALSKVPEVPPAQSA
jgi:hypothetical protein